MPEIGQTLRETRMRNRVDITEVEAGTKIRAKYLRALENEEWDLLPGPTFVKTFLRTYSEYLGLDPKLLVEEYKQRFERPGPQDLLPFAPQRGGRRQQRRSPAIPPFVLVALCVVALLGVLFAIGLLTGDDSGEQEVGSPSTTATPAAGGGGGGKKKKAKKKAAAPTRVSVRITPTATVNVCLVDGGGKVLIPSSNLGAGAPTRTFRGKRFKVTFGNGFATMRVGKRTIDVPDRDEPVGYDLRPGTPPRELPRDQRPTCAP